MLITRACRVTLEELIEYTNDDNDDEELEQGRQLKQSAPAPTRMQQLQACPGAVPV